MPRFRALAVPGGASDAARAELAAGLSRMKDMRLLLRALVAVGLAVDAYIHVVLAGAYDFPAGGLITQGDLFLIEAAAAGLAALLVLVFPRRVTFGFAFLVAASALGAVVLYRYVDVGSLGPLPNMYEPVWTLDKLVSAIAEAVAAVLALILFVWPRLFQGRQAV